MVRVAVADCAALVYHPLTAMVMLRLLVFLEPLY